MESAGPRLEGLHHALNVAAILANPIQQQPDSWQWIDGWAPSQFALDFADVGYEHRLISGARFRMADRNFLCQAILKEREQLHQRQRSRWPPTDVVDPARGSRGIGRCKLVSGHQVIDVQQIAYLQTIAVDGDRSFEQRCDREPGNPSLVLYAELPLTVDARLAEDHRRDAVDTPVVMYVLVSRAFATAVRRVKIERTVFRDAFGKISKAVSRGIFHVDHIRQSAVDLIGGRVDNEGIVSRLTNRLQHIEGTAGVDFEIFERAGDGRRDRNLRGEMQHQFGAPHRMQQRKVVIPDVTQNEFAFCGIPLLQVAQV